MKRERVVYLVLWSLTHVTECVVERLEAKGLALRFVETDGLHLGDDPQTNVTTWLQNGSGLQLSSGPKQDTIPSIMIWLCLSIRKPRLCMILCMGMDVYWCFRGKDDLLVPENWSAKVELMQVKVGILVAIYAKKNILCMLVHNLRN